MRIKVSILAFLSRRMRLMLVTALLVLGTKVAAAALVPPIDPLAPGAARVSLTE